MRQHYLPPESVDPYTTATKRVVDTWGFDPHAEALRQFRLAMARTRLGLDHTDVVHISDSLGWGYNITGGTVLDKAFPQYLGDDLRAQANCAPAPIKQYRDPANQATAAAGGSIVGEGFGFASRSFTGTPASNYVEWTGVCDGFTILYAKGTALGNANVTINGAGGVTVATAAGSTSYGNAYTVTGLGRASRTIRWAPLTSGDLVEVEGIYFHADEGTATVRTWSNSQVTATLNGFANVKTSWTQTMTAIDPDLVVISAGTNDIIASPTRRTVAQFSADLATTVGLVRAAQANDPSIVYVLQPRPQDPNRTPTETTEATWEPYRMAAYETCRSLGVAFVDVGRFLGAGLDSSSTAGIGYLHTDLIHWRAEAHQRVGDMLGSLVGDSSGQHGRLSAQEDVFINSSGGLNSLTPGGSLAYWNTVDGVTKLTNMPAPASTGLIPVNTVLGILWVTRTGLHMTITPTGKTWTNATGDVVSSTNDVRKIAASYFNQARVHVIVSVTGSATWGFMLQYSSTSGGTYTDAWASNWVVGTGTGHFDSGFKDLVSGAKGDLWFRVISRGGDGVADPNTTLINLEMR